MISIRSPRSALATTARPNRSLRVVLAALLTAVATTAVAVPAQANLSAVGPVDPSTGEPAWFQDGNGLKLGLCLTAPFCLSTAADFAAPDGEAFFFNAGADLTINGSGKAKLVLAQEAVSPPTGPAAFMRVRVVITGAARNTTYAVTHPYGTATVRTDATGGGRFSVDTGCTAAPCPGFAGALTGQIGPFLTWTPDPALPPGTIGDGLTPHTVTGGTNGNRFTVAGLGGSTTNLFTVAGKLAGPAVPVYSGPASMDYGSIPVGAPSGGRPATITSFGVPDAAGNSNLTVTNASLSGAAASDFQVVGTTCGSAMPSGASCAVSVQFTPTAAGTRTANLDLTTNAGTKSIALSGTGAPAAAAAAIPAGAVAGASASSRLAIRKLHLTHRMRRSRILSRGLRLSMVLPQGTQVIKVAVFRYRGKKLRRAPVWVGFRVAPSRLGRYHMTLDSRAIRRRLKTGRYQLRVTPGVSKKQLGLTTFTTLRITRR